MGKFKDQTTLIAEDANELDFISDFPLLQPTEDEVESMYFAEIEGEISSLLFFVRDLLDSNLYKKKAIEREDLEQIETFLTNLTRLFQ